MLGIFILTENYKYFFVNKDLFVNNCEGLCNE
jgi:hypothetical protein